MSVEWSGAAPDLLLTIDRDSREPLRSQVERQVRDAIRSRRLRSGELLPSSRALARALGLSRGVVQECYAQLQAEGYLVIRAGSGTRVAAGAQDPQPRAERAEEPPRLLADFQWGVPDLRAFPMTDWLWAMREAARAAPGSALAYGDAWGSAALRDVLAGYLRRVRACAADPERILVCSGYAQGLGLALHALARSGIRAVAFEDPGSPAAIRSAAAWAGMSAVPVPVDDRGIDVDALAATDARAVVVTPAHQWPTGVVLAPERRPALIDWAVRRNGVIVEDDHHAEFRYDRGQVGALQGLAPDRVIATGTVSKSLAPDRVIATGTVSKSLAPDRVIATGTVSKSLAPDRVIATGTVSKSLAPALRIGRLVCPSAIVPLVAEHKHLSDRGSPILDQLALARLIESGRYDRHLRRMRARYAARRATLVAALARHAPGVRVTGAAAGFHLVAHLSAAADERAVVAGALQRSVGRYGMSACRASGHTAPAQLVLGFGNLGDDALTAAVAAVGGLLPGAGAGPEDGHAGRV